MRPRLAQLHQSGATSGQVPVWNNATGQWEPGTASSSGIAATLLDAKGDLIVASAADTAARLAVGTDGQYLQADSAQATGVKWATLTALTDPTTTAGDLLRRNAANTALERLGVGSDGQVLTLVSGMPAWSASGSGSAQGINRVLNGNFRINQRAYVSAASLASGDFSFDRWKATTASTTLTYTSAVQGQSVTINSGGSIAQLVERANAEAGDYVLSWTGTATGRVYNSGGSAPAYAASPVTVTLDGLADVVVEFQASGATKTLSLVQLEAGSTATTFERTTKATQLTACQRYFWRVDATRGGSNQRLASGIVGGSTSATFFIQYPVEMRTSPTVSRSGTVANFKVYDGTATPACTVLAAGAEISPQACNVNATVASGLTAGRAAQLFRDGTNTPAYLDFAAEL